MRDEITKAPEPVRFERSYPGTKDQVGQVRKDLAPMLDGCPLADDFVLLSSELVTNAIVHSNSGLAGGMFTVMTRSGAMAAGTSHPGASDDT